MILLPALLGQGAVSLRTAATNGTVKAIRIQGRCVTHVELSNTTIPASAVRSFEGDVLTYDRDGVPPVDNPWTDPLRETLGIDGARLHADRQGGAIGSYAARCLHRFSTRDLHYGPPSPNIGVAPCQLR